MRKNLLRLFCRVAISVNIWGCGFSDGSSVPEYKVPESAFDASRTPPAPNYSEAVNWAVLPGSGKGKPVDVVFFHPTSCFGDESWNQAMPDERNNHATMDSIKRQAGVFEGQSNVYAPFYRQVSLYVLKAREEDRNKALNVAYSDIERAFACYIENFNDGKPFILAGHSQGSNFLLWLLERRVLNDPELRKQLVAAYVVGWSLTVDDIKASPQLEICESFDEAVCIVSYNTQEKDPEVSIVRKNAIGVNPLLWNTSA